MEEVSLSKYHLLLHAEPSEAAVGQGAADWGCLGHPEPAQLWRLWRHDPPSGTPAPSSAGSLRGTDTIHTTDCS